MKKILATMLALGLITMTAPTLAENAPDNATPVAEAPVEAVQAEEAPVEAAPAEEATAEASEAVAVAIVDTQKLDAAYTLALNAINAEDYEAAKEYLNVCFAYCDPQSNPTMYADLLLKRACIDLRKNESQWTGRNRTI